MSRRTASWLAWSLGLLSVGLLSASAVLLVLNGPTRVVGGAGVWGTANAPFIVLATALVFTLVGALVASLRPTNPIGWISYGIRVNGIRNLMPSGATNGSW
jgi:hypothetical protein